MMSFRNRVTPEQIEDAVKIHEDEIERLNEEILYLQDDLRQLKNLVVLLQNALTKHIAKNNIVEVKLVSCLYCRSKMHFRKVR